MTIEQDVQRFKVELLRKMPFYGDIVMRLTFEENRQIPTACTNGAKIYYNPAFFEKMEQGERYYVLLHEIFHVILLHCRRSANRDAKVWNTACDIIVNQMIDNMTYALRNAGIPIKKPVNGTYAVVSRDMTTDELYEQIQALNRKRKKNSKQLTIYKNFQWHHGEESNMKSVDVMDDLETYVVGKDGTVLSTGAGDKGGGLSGEPMTAEEAALNEQMIKRLIKESLTKNRSDMGSYFIPNQVVTLVESKKLNWRTLLKGFLNQKISDEASYTTPERKYLHMDLILPGYSMTDDALDEIWAFIDSSGSISQNEMDQFLTQLYRISKEFQCVTNICYWDTKVTDVYKNIRNEKDILKCKPKHSGGTDINCVYNWISENKVKPDVMIILTDGAFGRLTTPAFKKKYIRQTILVISSNRYVTEEMKKIGKIATL